MLNDRVRLHFDQVASRYDFYKQKHDFYYSNLKRLLKKYIPEDKDVCEIGCGTGDLITSLGPRFGLGYDLSGNMIKLAKFKHSNKNLIFTTKFPKRKFDYILLCDVVEHLTNPKNMLTKIKSLMNKDSQLLITMANPIWEWLLMVGEKVGYKMPEGPHNRFKSKKMQILISESGFEIIKHDNLLLIPIYIPFITNFVNKYLEPYFKKFAFIEYFLVRKAS